jgi:hypothetical protein
MMLRHLMRQREVIDNYDIYNDLQELMSGFENRRVSDDDARPAYEDNERRPKSHNYYKALKAKEEKKR